MFCSNCCWYAIKHIENLQNLSAKNLSKDHLQLVEKNMRKHANLFF